tara:strand:+ start:152 stop:550 length:399 start_codon:yes stop_codon:yes gene_type:complete
MSLKFAELAMLSLIDPTGVVSLILMSLGWKLDGLTEAKFSRDHEQEADDMGLKIAAISCFDTASGANVFAKLGAYSKVRGGGQEAFHYSDSHPLCSQRGASLKMQSEKINAANHSHCGHRRKQFKIVRNFLS